jgi:hypothetical protein
VVAYVFSFLFFLFFLYLFVDDSLWGNSALGSRNWTLADCTILHVSFGDVFIFIYFFVVLGYTSEVVLASTPPPSVETECPRLCV